MQDAIRLHAEAEYPRECCGVITDAGIIRCTNVSTRPQTNWLIDWRELQRIERRTKLLGVYHSHCDTNAQPSSGDLEQAQHAAWVGLYVICSVRHGMFADLQTYKLQDNKFIRI